MKKLLSLAVILALLLSCTGAALAQSCSAAARGFGGDVTVTLTIEDHMLIQVQAEGPMETQGIGTQAMESMTAAMLAANTVTVDTVSGATFTSNAVLAAAAQALEASGVTLAEVTVEEETVVYEDTQADVVVVGAGLAGMTAAMELYDAGLDVILIEKTDVTGGAAISSHSAVWAVGMPKTAEVYDFTSDEVYEFFCKKAPPVNSKEVFYAIADNSYSGYDFLVRNNVPIGAIASCNSKADPRFWLFRSVGLGAGMMSAMNAALDTRAIDVRTGTAAIGLLLNEDGSAAGVTARCGDQEYAIRADKVVLATGGFGQNKDMLMQYTTGAELLATNFTYAGSTGDGHAMGLAAGGRLVGEGFMGYASTPANMGNMDFGKPLIVNLHAEKVAGADDHYTVLHDVITKQEDQKIYVIFPSNVAEYNGIENSLEIMESHYNAGTLVKADTIEELAAQLGIDPTALRATVDAHNALCTKGESDAFNTAPKYMQPIEQGPFYAHVRETCIIGTIAGLAVNEQMEVLGENNQPIANLYAIGELMYGNFFTGNYPMSGTGLCACLTSGYIAAHDIASTLK